MTALTYCTVIGTFTRLDTDAAGAPPASTPLTGQVTITCDAPSQRLRLPTDSPPWTAVVDPFSLYLDPTGSLNVKVIATDQTGVTVPSGFTYTASFGLDGVKVPPFTFSAPSGGTVDLTVAAPSELAE